MDSARIRELLQPFLAAPIPGDWSFRAGLGSGQSAVLTDAQVRQFSAYLDLLLRWNSRINLTAVREPEKIIARHFGESLFAAQQLFSATSPVPEPQPQLLDFGSGAGLPGLPMKIWAPRAELTLIESNHKKVTFLREVIRTLGLDSVEVFSGRAENFQRQAGIVTFRAVEKFERSLSIAARLVTPGGRLALLIGESQVAPTQRTEPDFRWQNPRPIPLSSKRVLLIGTKSADEEPR